MVSREQPARERAPDIAPAEDRVLRAVLVSGSGNVQADEVFDLSRLWSVFRGHWLILSLLTVGGFVGGWGLSHLMTRSYRVEVVLNLVEDNEGAGGLHSLADSFGGIAGGLGLEPSSSDRERGATIAMLRSHWLIEDFISSHNLLPYLFPTRYDWQNKRWLRGAAVPTLQDGGVMFKKKILNVAEDRKTGLVTLKIEWTAREQIAEWANTMVAMANAANRERAIHDANDSISYLEKEAAQAGSVELKQSIFSLLESQMNKRMLAVTRPEFSFKVVDPAQTPRVRDAVSPIRPLFGGAGAFLALAIGCAVFLALQKPRSG
jgi:uncharacterized protein involved in exopolysaccharide biosynthesis